MQQIHMIQTKEERMGAWYELKVLKSNKRGAKYFNDEVLLSLMEGQFSGSTQMKGDFKQENLDAILKRLDQLGVTVTEEHKEDNNSQNSLRHSKKAKNIDQKDVPLYERKRKSYIRNGERHEGLEDELKRLDADNNVSDTDSVDTGGEGGERNSGTELPKLSGQENTEAMDARARAEAIRSELARRDELKEKLSKRYDINEKGDISLDNLSKMFRDWNSNPILGKIFNIVLNLQIIWSP